MKEPRFNILRSRKKQPAKSQATLEGLFLDHYPQSSRYADAFNVLKTNISLSSMDKDIKVLLLTSASESEGKTISTANLSFVLAKSGKKTLMIDGDMRRPKLSKLGQDPGHPGLSHLLLDFIRTDVNQGSLSIFSISDLFRLIDFQKKTGILELEEDNEEIHFYFRQGRPINVEWITRPSNQKMGEVLIKNGLINKEQFEKAVNQGRITGQKLGYILINMGLLKESDLTGIITIHIVEALRKALVMKTGTFRFKTIHESYYKSSRFNPVEVEPLYWEATFGEEELQFLDRRINECIIDTDIENLYLMPSGMIPPSPPELLESKRLKFLIGYLKKNFDAVLIDTPPVLPANDALSIAPMVDGIIMVIKAGKINRELLARAMEQIKMVSNNLIGVVLNDLNERQKGYYRYYSQYYGRQEG